MESWRWTRTRGEDADGWSGGLAELGVAENGAGSVDRAGKKRGRKKTCGRSDSDPTVRMSRAACRRVGRPIQIGRSVGIGPRKRGKKMGRGRISAQKGFEF